MIKSIKKDIKMMFFILFAVFSIFNLNSLPNGIPNGRNKKKRKTVEHFKNNKNKQKRKINSRLYKVNKNEILNRINKFNDDFYFEFNLIEANNIIEQYGFSDDFDIRIACLKILPLFVKRNLLINEAISISKASIKIKNSNAQLANLNLINYLIKNGENYNLFFNYLFFNLSENNSYLKLDSKKLILKNLLKMICHLTSSPISKIDNYEFEKNQLDEVSFNLNIFSFLNEIVNFEVDLNYIKIKLLELINSKGLNNSLKEHSVNLLILLTLDNVIDLNSLEQRNLLSALIGLTDHGIDVTKKYYQLIILFENKSSSGFLYPLLDYPSIETSTIESNVSFGYGTYEDYYNNNISLDIYLKLEFFRIRGLVLMLKKDLFNYDIEYEINNKTKKSNLIYSIETFLYFYLDYFEQLKYLLTNKNKQDVIKYLRLIVGELDSIEVFFKFLCKNQNQKYIKLFKRKVTGLCNTLSKEYDSMVIFSNKIKKTLESFNNSVDRERFLNIFSEKTKYAKEFLKIIVEDSFFDDFKKINNHLLEIINPKIISGRRKYYKL